MTGTAIVGDQTFKFDGKRTGTGDGDAKAAKAGPDEKAKDVVIDLEGFEARALTIPVPAGAFGRLGVNDKNQLLYVRRSSSGGDDSGIKLFDLSDDKKEEKSVAAGGNFEITPDGKKILVPRGGSATIQDASAGATGKSVTTAPMLASIDPRAEWRQLLADAWRIERDFFYVGNMHGVDWKAMRERYGAMIEDCASRDDVSFVISEMISELNIGHAYYSGGDVESGPSVGVGMLGCDFALENGAYRIKKVYRGAAWDLDAVGPLSQPGCTVKEGDYVLAVNGVPVDTAKDPWAAFVGLAGKTVVLTVNDKPSLERELGAAVVSGQRLGLFSGAFLAVFREGGGTALFLSASAFAADGLGTLVGAVVVLAAAALVGWALYASMVRLNLRVFFNATSVLLLFFAAGLFAHGLHEYLTDYLDAMHELGTNIQGSFFAPTLPR